MEEAIESTVKPKTKALNLRGFCVRYRVRDPGVIEIMSDTVLVIGGGIAGIQASLDLANAGARVVLVERGATIGGVMAVLDKNFPTLDCSNLYRGAQDV